MSVEFQLSPSVKAIDLLRLNIDNMSIDELLALADEVRQTCLGLTSLVHAAGHVSAITAANLRKLEGKLTARLWLILDTIEAHRAAQAAADHEQGDETKRHARGAKFG